MIEADWRKCLVSLDWTIFASAKYGCMPLLAPCTELQDRLCVNPPGRSVRSDRRGSREPTTHSCSIDLTCPLVYEKQSLVLCSVLSCGSLEAHNLYLARSVEGEKIDCQPHRCAVSGRRVRQPRAADTRPARAETAGLPVGAAHVEFNIVELHFDTDSQDSFDNLDI